MTKLIECLAKTTETVRVPIGNEKYEFRPDEHGRKVCKVWIDSHIKAFLARADMYRLAEEVPVAVAPVTLGIDPGAPEGDKTVEAVVDGDGQVVTAEPVVEPEVAPEPAAPEAVPAPEAPAEPEDAGELVDIATLTRAELVAELTERNIAFKSRDKVDDLRALLLAAD